MGKKGFKRQWKPVGEDIGETRFTPQQGEVIRPQGKHEPEERETGSLPITQPFYSNSNQIIAQLEYCAFPWPEE